MSSMTLAMSAVGALGGFAAAVSVAGASLAGALVASGSSLICSLRSS
jgi:hypothetical protein